MIQDIAPHKYDNSYVIAEPTAEDIALCYRTGRVLLEREGDGWSLPRFSLGLSRSGARHLFTIDGENCFLAEAPEFEPESCEYLPLMDLRTVHPMEVAFAAVTGGQLNRWYNTRKFCGRCGAKMEPGTTERSMVCPSCGLTEYPKISPAVIVAVKHGDKLLLTRYANRPVKNYALIAGFVEIGETLEQTIHREVLEEVGVHVKNLRYYKSQPWSFTDTLLVGYYCELDGDPAITLDHNELCEGVWLSREEIPCRAGEVSMTAEMIERFRTGEER